MTSQIEHQLKAQLESRKARSLLRGLVVIPETSADFSSNDFLGLARSPALNSRFLQELASFPKHAPPLGSTGSRLLDGNSRYAEDLEDMIAHFHHTEAALIFNSGFDANVGFFSSVPQPGDVILYDEYIHASVHDGMKVTRAGVKKAFLHNDLEHLAELLNTVRREDQERIAAAATTGARSQPKERNIFVAVESVYSMDGDAAPLREIVDLLEPFGAYLIVDEAHATGVYGLHGRGLVNELGLESRVFARLHTFSKALASNGAALVGPKILKEYLINYARPLIYSTFTSFNNLASIKSAYQMLISGETVELVEKVRGLVDYFRSSINVPESMLLPSSSPIQGIVMDGNAKVNALSQRLIKAGLNVKPIRFPTVPKGKERVRICLHSHNTQDQVERLIQIVHDWIKDDAMTAVSAATEGTPFPALDTPASLLTPTTPLIPSQDTLSSSSSSSSPTLSVSTLSAAVSLPIPSKL
ncbi:aminotransferase [Mortierella sp. GBAus27b]|nr:biotin synthase [Mortierella sp. GBA43]KAI8362145.1 aminotransferase [Mortierella sp. GBAus27b]